MNLPNKCIVDTNVPKTANRATNLDDIPDNQLSCVLSCIEAIEHIIKTRGLVIDAGDEIFNEYRRNISLKGQPGVGDAFMKWVHDYRWRLPISDRVEITKNSDSYNEFPTHADLKYFDISDRKFVATSNAHPDKPPILQATDSKWWGLRDALINVGIKVHFLCHEYIASIHAKKNK